jgi:hypothetical protein
MLNNYISRIGASVRRVGHALSSIDDFADKYLFDPLGEGLTPKPYTLYPILYTLYPIPFDPLGGGLNLNPNPET